MINLDIQDTISKILDYLNETKTRCTYSAMADVLGVSSETVGKLLGERRPETSWVVSAGTGNPSYYRKNEKHPELYRTEHIIRTADELKRKLDL